MTVSILLACYNGEKFLREQLDSILNQDFQDFILYISDDGSSDGTEKIISEYSAKDKRIKVFARHAPKKSACRHFLYMLENVESSLFLFCDQDDVWTENHISELVKKYERLSEKEKKALVLIHSDLAVVDQNLGLVSESFFDYALIERHPRHKHFYFLENNVTGGVMLINSAVKEYVFRNKKNLEENFHRIPMHDQFFALVANYFGTVLFVEKKLEYYRQHSNNVVGAKNVRSFKNCFQKLFDLDDVWLKKGTELASFFLDYYSDLIPEKENLILHQFLEIGQMSRFSAIRFIIKNDFLKENKKRQLLQILSILLRRKTND